MVEHILFWSMFAVGLFYAGGGIEVKYTGKRRG